jgi:uncharacterized protein YceH (UPF0502 family)
MRCQEAIMAYSLKDMATKRTVASGKRAATRAAERAMEQEIDAALARLEVDIAAQRERMDRLLERLAHPKAA